MTNYKQLTDYELFGLLKLDDRRAFTEIYGRYKEPLYIHAFHKLRDKEEVRDILQQLFSVLWMKRNEIVLNANLSGYLYASIRNRIFKIIARKSLESSYISSLQQSISSSEAITDYLVRENQMKQIIDREIGLLPKKMKKVFLLSRRTHLSHKEISKQLGISEQTVSKQMTNALKILRTKLSLFLYIILLIQ
ncbi:sigma-70 family RNA polymerase sigma factor [Sphingobacterium sp. SGG-5]|uniref:RNA polymerase sigma factor n=1 Tax=Sphingobacterium sp. SGG-5 TaxID=2710881 RepID=UPI0013EC42AF|nr:sigma-70 family RNA polymerase sigma factor [Sphingobacterium sp. SGG-5]NGM60535.1 sigma-70 family RNA polymerase sigma factor [Sphingobacterium sp. SGG-5]